MHPSPVNSHGGEEIDAALPSVFHTFPVKYQLNDFYFLVSNGGYYGDDMGIMT